MSTSLSNANPLFSQNNLTRKISLTLFSLFLFRLGNAIPLGGVDQEALKRAFLQLDTRNSLFQVLTMYTGAGGKVLLSAFSLGIVPFINASILIDLLTALVPQLEKLQSEEGEKGRQQLFFYKKIVTFCFAIVQSFFLLSYLKEYIYEVSFFSFAILILELVAGTMIIIWLTNLIDTKGLGNGTSLIIFANIVIAFLNKSILTNIKIDLFFFIQLFALLFIILLICISQTARVNINLVSARQLAFLENAEKNNENSKLQGGISSVDIENQESCLSIKLNQAGIFPIIIASNLLPFLSYFFKLPFGIDLGLDIEATKNITNFLYYILIIAFNYFYTIVFWDPEKISEQLRKASVSILNITPGKDTIAYLEEVVKSTSLLGGIFLCTILYFYEILKQIFQVSFLNDINISSLIILIGVSYELQKTLRGFSKNLVEIKSSINN